MLAISKSRAGVDLARVQEPRIARPDDVLVRVAYAGLCRTDVAVADGRIETPLPLVLGHEFSGYVEAVGARVTRLRPGDRVTAMPVLDCLRCRACTEDLGTCESPTMLGVHHHGAFAERVVVAGRLVHPIPDPLDMQTAAYAEPVAASLAVTRATIDPAQRGAVVGCNRIGELTHRVLCAAGFGAVDLLDVARLPEHPTSAYDFVIEASIDTEVFREIVRLVRPGGRVVLKSRQPSLVGIYLPDLILKEISLEAVNYGSFAYGIELLAERKLRVDDLFGDVYPLEEFRTAFAGERDGESRKAFFRIAG